VVEGGREGSGGGEKGCCQKGEEEEGSAHRAELCGSPLILVKRRKGGLGESGSNDDDAGGLGLKEGSTREGGREGGKKWGLKSNVPRLVLWFRSCTGLAAVGVAMAFRTDELV